MKYVFYLISLILFSCSSNENKENLKSNNDSKIVTQKQKEELSVKIKEIDTSIHIEIDKQFAKFKIGDSLIVEKKLREKKSKIGENNLEQFTEDRAFALANCLIVLRNYSSLGAFCHIPSVEKVELFFRNGKKVITNESLKSKSLTGFDFTSNFIGNKFSSPDNSWGLINIEAEGELYGALILKENGKMKEITFDTLDFSGELYSAKFNAKNELIYSLETHSGKKVNFIINKEGKYKYIEKSKVH